jgi:hypothetical protein
MFFCLGQAWMSTPDTTIHTKGLHALGQCPNMAFHYKEVICETHDTLPLCLLTADAVAVAFLSSDIEICSHS